MFHPAGCVWSSHILSKGKAKVTIDSRVCPNSLPVRLSEHAHVADLDGKVAINHHRITPSGEWYKQ